MIVRVSMPHRLNLSACLRWAKGMGYRSNMLVSIDAPKGGAGFLFTYQV